MEIIGEYLKLIGWGIVGILTMVLSLWIVLLVFTWLTPVDEWEELKKGNLAIALVMAAVISVKIKRNDSRVLARPVEHLCVIDEGEKLIAVQ